MRTTELLKSKHIDATALRTKLFKVLDGHKTMIAVKNGKPEMFLIPYEDMIDIVEIMEESKDAVLRDEIRRAREEYRGGGGVPFKPDDL